MKSNIFDAIKIVAGGKTRWGGAYQTKEVHVSYRLICIILIQKTSLCHTRLRQFSLATELIKTWIFVHGRGVHKVCKQWRQKEIGGPKILTLMHTFFMDSPVVCASHYLFCLYLIIHQVICDDG
jgi:hypothetical protein